MLDSLLAFSEVAKEFDLVKPILVDEHVIEIHKGRHILQQLCVDTYVPNDFASSDANSLIKIITGPNSCGKSVYLKQVLIEKVVKQQRGAIIMRESFPERVNRVSSACGQLCAGRKSDRRLHRPSAH